MVRNAQKELSLHIDIVVGGMGYISSDHKRELWEQSRTAIITRARENMFPPEKFVDHGCPGCPGEIRYRGMAMTGTPKCINILPQRIMLPVGFADFMVLVTKSFPSAL